MSKTVGDFDLERLAVWGVRRVFGCPGGINGVVTAPGQDPRLIIAVLNNRDLTW
jgi:hypothetical protein